MITTIAGNGQLSNAGDGSPATQASLFGPSSVVVDSAGNIYVNGCCSTVRRIEAQSGIISTYAGGGNIGFGGDGGQARRALFANPRGLALDAEGNLLISDQNNQRIRRITGASGIVNTVAGGGSNGDGGPAVAAQLFDPNGIALDSEGDIYVADAGGFRIRKISKKSGVITTIAGTGQTSSVHTGDGGPATSATFPQPVDVTLDSSKSVFFTAFGRVRKVDAATGIITTVAGKDFNGFAGDGGQATEALFNNPAGLALDAAGNIYISDGNNHRIRKID